MRKTLKKQKQGRQKQKPEVQEAPDARPVETAGGDNAFDFGGLPARDLKKNLGCG
jgi:hypothetical protein